MLNKQYVFNIQTIKFFAIIERIKKLNYVGAFSIEADVSTVDFNYNVIMMATKNGFYTNSILNLYTWKIRRDKRIKSMILSLKLMEV